MGVDINATWHDIFSSCIDDGVGGERGDGGFDGGDETLVDEDVCLEFLVCVYHCASLCMCRLGRERVGGR